LCIEYTFGFLADYSLIGLADSYGIELIHRRRKGALKDRILDDQQKL
jgi:hypothetical protein